MNPELAPEEVVVRFHGRIHRLKYHRGETTQMINPDKDAGKISDLGK